MVDRIRPIDTLVTISLGSTIRTQKFPASVERPPRLSQSFATLQDEGCRIGPLRLPASTNLIPNSSAETNTSGWVASGAATLSRVSNAG